MAAILQRIRDAVSGKKTILTAVIGILTAALAWAGGELTDWQAITAVWVAVQVIFIRTGSKKDVESRINILNTTAVDEAYVMGYTSAQESYSNGFESGFNKMATAEHSYKEGYECGYDDGYYEGDE